MRDRSPLTHDGLTPAGSHRLRPWLAALGGALVLLAAVLLLLSGRPAGQVLAAPTAAPPLPLATASPSSSAGEESATPTPTPSERGDDDAPVEPSTIAPAVLPVVMRFTDAWLLRTDSRARLSALTPVATANLAQLLSATDPNRIPLAKRSGAPEMVSAGEFHARARQGLSDGSSIVLDLVANPSTTGPQWQVASVRPGS